MTVSIGDLIRCIDCGHEAKVTTEWLADAIRHPSPRMRHFVERLKCRACGARVFEIVRQPNAESRGTDERRFGSRARASAD